MYKITDFKILPKLPDNPFLRAIIYEVTFCDLIGVEVKASKDSTKPVIGVMPARQSSFIVYDKDVWHAIIKEIRARFNDDLATE